MAKGCRGRRRTASRRLTPYSLPSYNQAFKGFCMKKCSKVLEKKDWEDVTCSVCMEYPHNAVLLLCSSHDKGCRPYMCGTSYRHSNCLYQYKKAYTKVTKVHHSQPLHSSVNFNVAPLSSSTVGKGEVAELSCPLCRGQVKGWTVVEVVRDFLNAKKRSCMQQNCSFVGNYKELRKHVRASHPAARPHEVDPAMEQSWRRLENEREQDDVLSMIRSSMPGATVFGDYVIDGNHYEFDSDEGTFDANLMDRDEVFDVGLESNLVNMFLLIHAFGSAGSAGQHRQRPRVAQSSAEESAVGIHHNTPVDDSDSFDQGDDHDRSEEIENGITALFGQSGRRRRHR
ncbi:hypothetical protein Nepgr_005752 [Nepenthes gracilis]|uniref:Uncharacterized protein n=1 Tax=Nepenthes gracilis TaxID=150966 RepID=A0AAD3XGR7_NEPGR|nr:hypothetical protein Nepgr_005752 [Nepenthes gracilis]